MNHDSCKKNTTTTVPIAAAVAGGCARVDRVCDSVLDAIGGTPLIRLKRIGSTATASATTAANNVNVTNNSPNNLSHVEFLVKCEFFNAGGSVKDRIGRQMVEDAEREGRIRPGDTLIEPTSGNTGIGLALACAVKGYKCIITMPEKMSKEKVDVLKALGAEIIRTPTEAAFDAPDSHISVARRLQQEIPNSHILDQYSNPSNPAAHYHGTAEEIIRQTAGRTIDMLVAGAGTGGTISGIAQRLKEHNPNILIVGVDPEGSILAIPDSLNDTRRLESYHVEGIGYDFIPQVLNRDLVDYWYKSNDKESLVMMRRLIRDEGLLCGGSSGSAVSCALQAAADHFSSTATTASETKRTVVIILPDSVRNYMTKALSDDWMLDHGFVDGDVIRTKLYQSWWAQKRVCDLPINTPLTITSDVSCKDAIMLLKQEGFDMVPVLEDGSVIGVVTEGNMTSRLLAGRARPDDTVKEAGVIYKNFHKFNMNATLSDVAQALDHEPYCLIVTEQRCYSASSHHKKRKPCGTAEESFIPASSDSSPIPSSHVNNNSKNNNDDSMSSSNGRGKSKVVNLVSGIVTRIDLIDYISTHSPEATAANVTTGAAVPVQP